MHKLAHTTSIMLIVAGAMLLFQQRAYGYTDPGSGFLLLQIVGSALAATGWFLRRKFHSLFHRGAAAKQPEQMTSVQEDKGSSPH
ncbi:MAG: hypothetical protein ABSF53_00055 [Terracidiphilus sp.]|jgi:hypothetical protein